MCSCISELRGAAPHPLKCGLFINSFIVWAPMGCKKPARGVALSLSSRTWWISSLCCSFWALTSPQVSQEHDEFHCQSCTLGSPLATLLQTQGKNKIFPPPVRQNEKNLPKLKIKIKINQNKKESCCLADFLGSLNLCFWLIEADGATGIKVLAQPPCSASPCPGISAAKEQF